MFSDAQHNLGMGRFIMGRFNSVALAATALALLAIAPAKADVHNMTGSTMTKDSSECCGFDFSLLHPISSYDSNGLGVQRQISDTPIAFQYNDTTNNGLSAGDTLTIAETTMSLGNIGGGEVTLKIGSGRGPPLGLITTETAAGEQLIPMHGHGHLNQ